MWNPLVIKWNAAAAALTSTPISSSSPFTSTELSKLRDFEPANTATVTVTVVRAFRKVDFRENPGSIATTGAESNVSRSNSSGNGINSAGFVKLLFVYSFRWSDSAVTFDLFLHSLPLSRFHVAHNSYSLWRRCSQCLRG